MSIPKLDKALVQDLATAEGVCIRPLLRRLVDRATGEARSVVLPCGSTRESRCPSCAKRARSLRMHQCAEGWHLQDEVPDREPNDDDTEDNESGDESEDDTDESSRRVRSTKRRQDATDLPVRPVEKRTVGTTFPGNGGQVFRPSMFTTLTMPSYGKVVPGVGVPLDPARYDYRRGALDAMHFAKLFDRWMQNLRRCAGYQVQYFAAVEPQRRLAPHLHAALRGRIERTVIRQVTKGTYFQLWWPQHHTPLYVRRIPLWDGLDYLDPDTETPLRTWDQALADIDQDPDAKPAHVMRFGSQVDIKGIIAPSPDADRTIRYLTKYLAKSMANPMTAETDLPDKHADARRQHHDRMSRQVRWLPCSPDCTNWLRYGIQPKNTGPGMAPGSCPSKAHDCEHLGLGGRRVLVSRKWTGKTLDMHKADRAAVVRQVLQEAGIEVEDKDKCAADVLAADGQPRFQWTTLPLGDSSYQDTICAEVVQRRAWREQYEQAKRATAELTHLWTVIRQPTRTASNAALSRGNTMDEMRLPEDRLWSADEVSYYLGVPVTTLYQWKCQRQGPPVRRVGRFLRYRADDVKSWVARLDNAVA